MDRGQVAAFHKGLDIGLVVFAALPDYVHVGAAGAAIGDPFLEGLVEGAAAEASAYDQKVFPGRVELVVLLAFGFEFGRCLADARADGVAGEDYLVGGEELLHSFVGHADAADLVAEHLVGEACEPVLLLDEAGHAEFGGGKQQRSAGRQHPPRCQV